MVNIRSSSNVYMISVVNIIQINNWNVHSPFFSYPVTLILFIRCQSILIFFTFTARSFDMKWKQTSRLLEFWYEFISYPLLFLTNQSSYFKYYFKSIQDNNIIEQIAYVQIKQKIEWVKLHVNLSYPVMFDNENLLHFSD